MTFLSLIDRILLVYVHGTLRRATTPGSFFFGSTTLAEGANLGSEEFHFALDRRRIDFNF